MILLEQEDAIIVLGQVLAVFTNISQTVVVNPVNVLSGNALGCSVIVLGWVENEMIRENATLHIVTNCVPSVFVYKVFQLYPVERLFPQSQAQEVPLRSAHIPVDRLLVINSIIRYVARGTNVSHFAAIASFGVGTAGDQITLLFDVDLNVTIASGNESSLLATAVKKIAVDVTISTVVGVLYAPQYDVLLIVGLVDTTVVGDVVSQGGTVVYTVDRLAWVTPLRVLFFTQYPVAQSTATTADGQWLFIQVAQNTGLSTYLRIKMSDVLSSKTTSVLLPSAAPFAFGDTIVSAAFDPTTAILILAVNNGINSKFVQLRLLDNEYTMLGSQQSPTLGDRRYADSAVSNTSRLVFFLQVQAAGVAIRRYILVQITSLMPQISDRRGGTVVSVTGRGFAYSFPTRFQGTALCRIESSGVRYTVPATVINSTLLTCRTNSASTSICSPDIVEVAIYNSYFTTNSLLLSRYDVPVITSIDPVRQIASALSPITVFGTNLQASPMTICSFTWNASTSNDANSTSTSSATNETTAVMITRGVGLPGGAILCDAPRKGNSSYADLAGRPLVDVACDGTIFSGQSSSYANFTSAAAAILTAPQSVSLNSSSLNSSYPLVPTITVTFLDAAGLPLGNLFSDVVELRARLVSPGAVLVGNDSTYITTGTGTMSQLALLNATVGVKLIEFYVLSVFGNTSLYSSWRSTVAVTISPGSAHHVVVVVSPARQIPEVNTISEVDVQIEDAAGNTIITGLGSIIANFTVIPVTVVPVPPNVLAYFSDPDPPSPTTIVPFSEITSRAVQSAKPVHPRAGFDYIVHVSIDGGNNPVLPADTITMTTSCLPGRVRLIGSYQCGQCPDNCDCDDPAVFSSSEGALHVQVLPGFWRNGLHATQALACSPFSSCLGGNNTGQCSDGYFGPLCGLCSSGYGRSLIGGQCNECFAPALSFAAFVAVLALVLSLIVLVVVSAVQNSDNASELVLFVKLLVTHMHTVMAVGSLHVPFPDYFRTALAWCGIFSVRVLDYFFSDCVLATGAGKNSFFTKFVVFAVTPAISVILASVAWLVITVAPNFLKFEVGENNRQRRRERHEQAKRLRELQRQLKQQTLEVARLEGRRADKFAQGLALAHQTQITITHRMIRDAELDIRQRQEQELQQRQQQRGKKGGAESRNHQLAEPAGAVSYSHLSFTAVQVLVFFTFPATVFYAFLVVGCRKFDDGLGGSTSLLVVDLTVDCHSALYSTYYVAGVVVGCSFLFIVPTVFSIACIAQLVKNKTSGQHGKLSKNFAFTLLLIKDGSWFWAPLTLLRLGLQSTVVATIPYPEDVQVLSWLFVLFLCLLVWIRPYWDPAHMRLEALSILCCLVAANISVLFALVTSRATWVSNLIAAIALTILLIPVAVYILLLSKGPREWMYMTFHRVVLAKDVTESDSSDEDGIELKEEVDKIISEEAANRAGGGRVPPSLVPPSQLLTSPMSARSLRAGAGFDEILDAIATSSKQQQQSPKAGSPAVPHAEESPSSRRSRELIAAMNARAALESSHHQPQQQQRVSAPITSASKLNLKELLHDDDDSSDGSLVELELEDIDVARNNSTAGGNRFSRFNQRRLELPPQFTVLKPASGVASSKVAAAYDDEDSSDNEIF